MAACTRTGDGPQQTESSECEKRANGVSLASSSSGSTVVDAEAAAGSAERSHIDRHRQRLHRLVSMWHGSACACVCVVIPLFVVVAPSCSRSVAARCGQALKRSALTCRPDAAPSKSAGQRDWWTRAGEGRKTNGEEEEEEEPTAASGVHAHTQRHTQPPAASTSGLEDSLRLTHTRHGHCSCAATHSTPGASSAFNAQLNGASPFSSDPIALESHSALPFLPWASARASAACWDG